MSDSISKDVERRAALLIELAESVAEHYARAARYKAQGLEAQAVQMAESAHQALDALICQASQLRSALESSS